MPPSNLTLRPLAMSEAVHNEPTPNEIPESIDASEKAEAEKEPPEQVSETLYIQNLNDKVKLPCAVDPYLRKWILTPIL